MQRQDFYFDLPQELIAQHPLEKRTASRLLVYHRDTQQSIHQKFSDLPNLLESGDLLVMNNTKVMKARLYGTKISGGKIELLIERILNAETCLAQIRASKAPKNGCIIQLQNGWQIEVQAKQDDMYQCQVNGSVDSMLEDIGYLPLPPYIQRQTEAADDERYQTVYAEHPGSVAAPTAGLHFDEALLTQLRAKGIRINFTTLHVGAGTFQPVRTDNILAHKMHHERYTITESLRQAILETKAAQKRVIAVGTTAMRSLESAKQSYDNAYDLRTGEQETNIFIYPGYEFKICDGLITNFHLPESTLLMLVSAFIGHQQAMALYTEAILHRYRFFSYGDACLFL